MGLVRARHVPPHRDADTWWAVRACGRLLCAAVAVVLAAFLWPVGLGGCTSLATVPAGGAGAGLVAGDVLVVRCGPPDVGDRVVRRSADGAWVVGRVVEDADGSHVRADDGDGRAVERPGDLVGVLALRVEVPTAAARAGGVVAAVVLAAVAGRRLQLLFAA